MTNTMKKLTVLLVGMLFVLCTAMALAVGMPASTAFADSVTVIVPVDPGGGTSTIVTVTETDPVIGDIVSFAEHEWYVIGTDSEGVIAPEGCYTLFAKNNDFGSTAFRAGASDSDYTANYYKDSDLQKKMVEIANGFSSEYKANIVARDALDDIAGDAVTDQLLWPISEAEWYGIDISLRAFPADYWTRRYRNGADDVFIGGSGKSWYRVSLAFADGSVVDGPKGVLSSPPKVTSVYAVRPAAYVKTDAVEEIETKEYKPVVGSQIRFAGYDWYIVGMGDTGPVPGPANTVTLFAASVINDDDDNVVYVNTANNYADGDLSTVMKGLSDTLGLSAREKALITNRTLTTADGISGNSVTTPFWPLSIDEYDAINEFDPSMGACSNAFYWLRTGYGSSAAYYVDNKGKVDWNYGYTGSGVRPACYLDLSDLFFASGDSRMGDSVGAFPSKLEAPLYDTIQRYNFVLHDDTLSLSMIGAAKQRGSSLTFHYDAVQGEQHYLSYLVERASEPGIPVYYGRAVNLSNSGSGTVTVPLTDDGNMRTGIPLVNGEYILRFYTEDRSQDSVIFAGDTVDLDIRVEDNLVYINDLKDVSPATMVGSMGIDPGQADVEAGKQFQFSAFISPFTETGWFDPVLIWDVTGASSYGTSISQDGLLTVALNETSTELRVTVTSRQDYEIQCVSLVTVTPHVHVGTLVAGTPATCTESGTKDYYTCVCGKCFEDADCTTEITDFDTWKIISPLGHDFVWTSNGDGTHTGVCQHDGCEETVTDNCSGGEATFFDYAICEVCGSEYGELIKYRATTDFDGQTYYYETFGEAVDALGEFSTTAENRAVLKLFDNIDLTSALTFNTGFITLDLNGYMLKQTGSGSVISINEGADFILDDLSGTTATHNYYVAEDGLWTFYDGDLPEAAPDGAVTGVVTGGVLTGGNALYGGVNVYGTFTMNGGTISGNVATRGGGVYMGDGSTFTMTDGTISGNVAASGGGVYVNGGTFTMNGGTISGNTAVYNNGGGNGGGVLVGSVGSATGIFTMSGGTVSDNDATYYGSGLYLYTDGNAEIGGGYFDGSIYMDGTISVSGGYFAEEVDTAYLAENCVLQDVSALGGATFDGDYKDGFTYAVYAKGVVSISTEENIVYDGFPVAEGVDFTVEGADGVTLPYSYKTVGGDDFTAGLPTNAGEYTVSACALNGEKQFISVLFDITIAKATYDMSGIKFADGNFTYDREAHSIAISGTLPSGVSVSYDVSYKVNAGEYTVTATFTGDSANYNAIPVMTAKLTIAKADYDMSGITFEDGSFTYDGQAHSLVISGTLPTGVSVTYAGNDKTNAGEYTVTATFVGDYDNYIAIPDITATLTIAKAAPAYTAPTDLTVVAEGTLADIALPDGWAWKDGTVRLTETGEYKAVAVYTAADTANYNPVEVELTITVLEPEGLSGGAIAGIVIGSVLGALIIAYGVCALLYKKKIVKGAFFAKIYPFIKD